MDDEGDVVLRDERRIHLRRATRNHDVNVAARLYHPVALREGQYRLALVGRRLLIAHEAHHQLDSRNDPIRRTIPGDRRRCLANSLEKRDMATVKEVADDVGVHAKRRRGRRPIVGCARHRWIVYRP